MTIYPFKLKPEFKERIWGGQRLKEFFGKSLPQDKKIGESWELADLPNGKSTIANGKLAGMTLGEAANNFPAEVMGDPDFKGDFPLLIKFLDAQDVLSVQVHPDEEACKRMGKGEPKTECWYILHADPDAFIYKGLKENITPEKLREAIEQGTVEECIRKVPVTEGECHFLPSGTIHAVGPGLVIAEIQMPSDTTYRVFDWNRVDDTGKGRELHVKEALQSTNFDESPDMAPAKTGRLVDCQYFKVDKGHQAAKNEVLLKKDEMCTLIILKGKGTITGQDENLLEADPGDTILIPAAFEGVFKASEECEYLKVTL